MKALFDEAAVPYPPGKVVLVGLKNERKLQVYASGKKGPPRFVHEYSIQTASGTLGPKLREGQPGARGHLQDNSLNPNSLYHLAIRVGYPNDWDKEHARKDGRKDLGGDIMIHGGYGSCGCLAMGDEVAESFVLAARTGSKMCVSCFVRLIFGFGTCLTPCLWSPPGRASYTIA